MQNHLCRKSQQIIIINLDMNLDSESVPSPPTKGSKKKIHREKIVSEEEDPRLSALIHTATKDFHKQAKILKSFECQKIVKKIKSVKEKKLQDDAAVPMLQLLEEKLKWTKAFQIDIIVDECLRRLGLSNASMLSHDSNMTQIQSFTENMITQKRLKDALEKWNQKYTDFRIRVSQRKIPSSKIIASNNQHKRKRIDQESVNHLFVDSLSGHVTQEEGGEEARNHVDDDYDDGDNEHGIQFQPKKKNRMGQKQRKAKALAIQAKKAGTTWDKSLNWRAKKKIDTTASEDKKSSSGLSSGVTVADVADMGTSWKEEGKAHPSWAAREALKAKIVPFTGTKITFE